MNTNPLATLLFLALAPVLVILTWRTARQYLRTAGSVDALRKRQLVQAQKDELVYAQAAEYYGALREASRATIARLDPKP